jgi:hypothetical protein
LDLFGVKLADASKKFGKKFACGASVTKDASNKEQIDVQARGGCATARRTPSYASASAFAGRLHGRNCRVHLQGVERGARRCAGVFVAAEMLTRARTSGLDG